MLTSKLISEVQDTVKDTSFNKTEILDLLNQGQLEIAGGGNRQHGLPKLAPLPELVSSDTVTATASANSVSLPDAYQRHVFMVVDADGNKLEIERSYINFLKRYPTVETGDTVLCCVVGKTFYYAPAKAQDLTVHFFRKPVDMTTESDSEPDGIPEHLQKRLLYNFACKELFDKIEQEQEDKKSNTLNHENKYQMALTDLERHIGPKDKRAQNVPDDSDYINTY